MSAVNLTDVAAFIQLRPLAIGGALVLGLLYVIYLRVLPEPLPGIPHNVESSRRVLGNLPRFFAVEKPGHRVMDFWADVVS